MKDYINEMLAADRWELTREGSYGGIHLRNRNILVLKNGLYMSVQASEYHYCTPRDSFGPYTHVEVGFPSRRVEEIIPYAEDQGSPTDTVYGYVPVEILNKVIHDAGGLVSHHELARIYSEVLALAGSVKTISFR